MPWRIGPALALSLLVMALLAAPAGATVQFTKQWIGGAEFLSPTWTASDADGNVYVSDGAFNTSRVLKLDAADALIDVIGGFGSDPGQFNANSGVTTDASGNIYVAEQLGQRVQKFDPSGSFVLTFGKGVNLTTGGDRCTAASGDLCQPGTVASTGGGFDHPVGVTTDSAGNVYVLEFTNRRVQKFDSSGNFLRAWGFGVADGTNVFQVCTVAASCHAGTSGSGDGQFSGPIDIAADSADNVYVTDAGNDRIQKFDSSGTFLTKWGTSGSGAGQFTDVQGIEVDSSDRVYAPDFSNSNVQVFTQSGTFVRSFGKGVNHTTGGDTCTAASGDTCGAGTTGMANGQFFGAFDIVVSASGTAYVGDGSSRVQKFDSSGAFVSNVGTAGSKGAFNSGIFYLDVATDAAGNVYTVNQNTSRIQAFNPVGASLNAWGTTGSGAGEVAGPAAAAVDSAGNVYVAEEDNDRVSKYDSNGNFVLTWGKQVDQTTLGNVCTAASGDTCQAGIEDSSPGAFNTPTGLTVAPSGKVYVADTGNDRIESFTSSGGMLDLWGGHGSADGQFDVPTDVATDSLGEVYVTDRDNNRVQRFNAVGTFLGKWGGPGTGTGQFDQPVALATDSQRNVYVVDYGNARVQVFRPTGSFVEAFGAFGTGQAEFNGPSSIALGTAARVYVADSVNNRIEMFTEDDTTAPQTTINSGPAGATNDPTPTFSFTSSEPSGALFECRVDGSSPDDFQPCASPRTTAHLTDGLHRFEVRAVDSAGNVDTSASSRGIKVDSHRPTSVAIAPATTHRKPFNVTYTASDPSPATGLSVVELWARRPGQATFTKVATDNTPNTTRSFSYVPRVGAGTYRFYTRAKDKVGNYEGRPATADASTAFSP